MRRQIPRGEQLAAMSQTLTRNGSPDNSTPPHTPLILKQLLPLHTHPAPQTAPAAAHAHTHPHTPYPPTLDSFISAANRSCDVLPHDYAVGSTEQDRLAALRHELEEALEILLEWKTYAKVGDIG